MSNGRMIVTILTIALANVASFAFSEPNHARQITSPDHPGTPSNGPSSGSFGSIAGSGGKHEPESTTVSLDSVSSNPSRYEGKTLARRVELGGMKEANGAVALGMKDGETGTRIAADPDATFSMILTKDFAGRLDAARQAAAIVTFTVTKIPIPGHPMWVGIISRVQILGSDGSVAKTVEVN